MKCKLHLFFAAASLIMAVASAETIRVLNWSDYIDESVLEDFTQQYGVDIDYHTFEDEEEFLAAYFNAEQPWDVIVPSDYLLTLLIEREQLSPINKAAVANYGDLNKDILGQLSNLDPGNQYAIPYMWGTTGIGVNTRVAGQSDMRALQNLGWSLLYDARMRAPFVECGIVVINDRNEVFASALKHLGYSINTTDKDEIAQATEIIGSLAQDVKYFHSGLYTDELMSGEACLVLGYSGDIIAAQYESESDDIQYIVPNNGAVIWVDIMAIPKNARQPKAALEFISYLTQPEVAATNTNYNAYPNPVVSSRQWVEQELLDNPAVYPNENIVKRLESMTKRDNRTRRLIRKSWVQANCKAGAYCEVPLDAYGY